MAVALRPVYLLRHALSVLALPFTVTVVIPAWIARRSELPPLWPSTALEAVLGLSGVVVFAVGLVLFAASYTLSLHDALPIDRKSVV